jgi:hypothetical protein
MTGGNAKPPIDLRYSERKLWNRGDEEIQMVLARLARERAGARAARDAAAAAVARGELPSYASVTEPFDDRTAQARAEAFRFLLDRDWLTAEQHDEAFKVGEMIVEARERGIKDAS